MEVEIIPRFDYAQIDQIVSSTLKQRAERIRERTRRAAQDIWENGREFSEAQQELARYHGGTFQDWAEAETGYSLRTVYNCINVYKQLSYANFAQLNIATSALYLLADPSTPDEVRQEVIEQAQNNENGKVTYTDTKEKVTKAKSHKKTRQHSSASGPKVESQAPRSDPEMNQDPDRLYGNPTYQLELACDEKTWRTIKRVFNPTWAAQVLAAAANFEERELVDMLGITRQEEPFYFD